MTERKTTDTLFRYGVLCNDCEEWVKEDSDPEMLIAYLREHNEAYHKSKPDRV